MASVRQEALGLADISGSADIDGSLDGVSLAAGVDGLTDVGLDVAAGVLQAQCVACLSQPDPGGDECNDSETSRPHRHLSLAPSP